MYKIAGTIISLLGLYIYLRHNVYAIDGQVIFSSPLRRILQPSYYNVLDVKELWADFYLDFFHFLIPILFIIGGLFIFKKKLRAVKITTPIIIIDILKRIYDATSYFTAPNIPIPEATEGSIIIIFNPWPSIIICIFEVIALLLLFGTFYMASKPITRH